MLFDAPPDMDGEAMTQASAHLFQVNKDNPVLLNSEKKEVFVHHVMLALYMSQQEWPNIQTVVTFLCR